MSVQDNKAVVRRILDEAFSKRNLAVGATLMAAPVALARLKVAWDAAAGKPWLSAA
jgi:hypothetical protein